ncbi:MAG: HAD-IIIA family hydrolase [Gemmataceae bacterium]|nr:HAD-IIIA family hydrolase [Gemmataceae bacterium]
MARTLPGETKLDPELEQARQHAAAGPCPDCNHEGTRRAFRVQKEGPNKGRLFIKCRECERFEWWPPPTTVAEAEAAGERDPELAALQGSAGPCPRCGQPRKALRVKKKGTNQGRLFLRCNDPDCDSFEWAPKDPAGKAPVPQAQQVTASAKGAKPKEVKAGSKRGKKPAAPAEPAAPQQAPAVATVGKHGSQEVILVGGYPASGKTTVTRPFVEQGYQRLNRDTVGGKVDDLLPRLRELLATGHSVVLDNLYATRASRAGAVALANQRGVPVRFLLLDAGLEDAQFNACLRMMERCGRVLHPEDHKQASYRDDPNLFPVAVLYKYRKEFEEPKPAEGFASVEKVPFVRQYPREWTNKAVIFDFDGTLRTHEGKEKYPLSPSEVRGFVERAPRVKEYAGKGYLLLGASNQSGIAKGNLTAADAEACFAETLKQLELKFGEVRYCPHKVPPISCYCRKPGPGMGVELIVKYKLDPRQCLYVGDLGTDASFAARCGFQFVEHNEFFR